jgi:hypothetical protein
MAAFAFPIASRPCALPNSNSGFGEDISLSGIVREKNGFADAYQNFRAFPSK